AGKVPIPRTISPPPDMPKSRQQEDERDRKLRNMTEKLEEYEDTIEALKERIAELSQDLKSTNEKLSVERNKPTPVQPIVPVDNPKIKDLEDQLESYTRA